MNLIPWRRKKDREITAYQEEMDHLLDRFFGGSLFSAPELLSEGKWFPNVDISEGRKKITVKAEMPGVESSDIDISLDGRFLQIKGEKKQEKEESDENLHRVERSYGYFNRIIELPSDVDPEKVDATYKRGVLTVKLKKTQESETRLIKVKAG